MTDRRFDSYEAKRQFIEDMRDSSLILTSGDDLIADGEWHRCTASNKEGSRGRNDGSYILHLTSNAAHGGFQNFTKKTGFIPWHYRSPGHRLSDEERNQIEREYKEHRAAAEAKRAKARAKATREANELWRAAEPAGGKDDFETHQYLRAKGIKAHGARVLDGLLLVPMYSYDGKLVNLHKINNQGDKWLIKGGQKIGTYAVIKAASDDDGSTICCAEGFSTAASINEATGYQVFLSIGTDILRLAHWLADEHPKRKVVICADDDHLTEDNPGLTAAKEAARATNSWLAIPSFGDDRHDETDFNDLFCKHGAKAVRLAMGKARKLEGRDSPRKNHSETTKQSDEDGDSKKKAKQTEIVLASAAAAGLFHTDDAKCFADIVVNGHRETWPIRSRSFRQWLVHQYYKTQGGSVPGQEAVRAAIENLEARARFDGKVRPVYVRIGGHGGKIYLDLVDKAWRAVEIDQDGWRIITNPPVRFRRAPNMMPLPAPRKGAV
jgi:phage/plasmid primase-like uncharacterized protein